MLPVEVGILTLPDHLGSQSVFVSLQSLVVFCVVLCRPLIALFCPFILFRLTIVLSGPSFAAYGFPCGIYKFFSHKHNVCQLKVDVRGCLIKSDILIPLPGEQYVFHPCHYFRKVRVVYFSVFDDFCLTLCSFLFFFSPSLCCLSFN